MKKIAKLLFGVFIGTAVLMMFVDVLSFTKITGSDFFIMATREDYILTIFVAMYLPMILLSWNYFTEIAEKKDNKIAKEIRVKRMFLKLWVHDATIDEVEREVQKLISEEL